MKTKAEGNLSRPFGRLSVFVSLVLLLCTMAAQAMPVKTVVQDTLYRADGQVAQGMLTIRWNAFSTSAGDAVPAGELTANIAADGSIAIPLIPNTGSNPSGGYYTVILKLSDGTTSQEQWVVPVASATTVAAVRAKVVPQSVATQFVGRDYVDSAMAAIVPASLMHLTGAETVTGAKTFSVSPEVPAPSDAGSAVARGYVDQQIGALAKVATTGSFNDLSNQPTVPNLAAPGAIGSATPGAVNATAYSVNGAPLASANLSDVSMLARTDQANSFVQPQTVQSVITAQSPAADIRAYGARCDGVTDDTAALQAAITALHAGGKILGAAAGATCYIANPAQLTWGSSGVINLTLQGNFKVGTTFVVPDSIDIIGEGGGSYVQYQGVGPAAGISGLSTNGTLGTSFSAGTATFTPSTMTGIVPGAAITVAGTVACSISSIARTSNVVTATLSSNCRIPPGASVTIAGVSDTSYNGTFFVTGSDYVQNTVTWKQTAANGSSSGGTATGLNEDSVETVSITATTSSTAAATFAHAHNAADRFGVVVIATKNMSFGHKSLQNITVSGCGGACIWTNYSFSGAFKNVGAAASQIMTSIPLVMSTTSNWVIEGGSFLAATGSTNPGLPWGIYFTETASASGDTTGAIEVSDSFISRGVKFDLGGYTRGQLANGMKFRHTTMERAASAVRVEPIGLSGNIGTIDLDMIFRQDNLDGFTDCPSAITYTDKVGGSGQVFLSEGPNVSQCAVGGYFDGKLVAKTQGNYYRPNNTRTPIGVWTDGKTLDAEIPGEGANLSPALVPYATANLPDPTSWTSGNCSVTQGVTAPDGSTTAVALGNTSWQSIGSMTVPSVATGDRIVYGGWWKPAASGKPNGGYPFYIEGTTAAPFDSPVSYEAYPGAFMSGFINPWWTPLVAIANIATGDNASHSFAFRANCPTQLWGTFMMYVPASVPTEEVQRLQRQLLHGYVPSNMPGGGGMVAMNPNHKLMWGSDTNLYRGSAGTVQTDGSINIGSGKQYQVNGAPIGTGNLGDWTNAGVANGSVPVWNSSSGKWTPGSVAADPLHDPGSNGIVKRIAMDTTAPATSSDVVSLFGGGSCSGYLKSDGSCATPSGSSAAGMPGQTLQANSSGTMAASFASPFFTASGVNLFGDSITVGYGPPSFAQGYASQVQNLFGQPFNNFARSGDQAADTARAWVFPYMATSYTLSPNSVIMIGSNDANACGSSAGCQANYQMALQASVAHLAIPQRNKTRGQDCTVTAGSAAADNTIPGIHALSSTTNGTVISCTTHGGGTKVDVAWRAIDGNGGVAAVAIDGTTVDTLNGYGNNGQNIHTQNNTNDTIFAKEYTVANASNHTVTFTVTSATSSSNKFSVVWVATPMGSWAAIAPPKVLVMAPPTPSGGTGDAYGSLAQAVANIYANDGLPVQFVNTRSWMDYTNDLTQTPTNLSGQSVTDVVTTAGSSTVTSASANFGPSSVGKAIEINGASASGGWLDATVTGYTNSTTVTISPAAATAGSGLTAYIGQVGQVCGLNTSAPWYLHPNSCGEAHIRDALLATAQPVTQWPGLSPSWPNLTVTTSEVLTANPYPSATKPTLYIDYGTSEPSSWGNYMPDVGINAQPSVNHKFVDFRVNGGSSLFNVDYNGNAYAYNSVSSSTGTFTQTPVYASNPILYLNSSGSTAVSSWGTHPPMIGINALGTAFNFLDFRVNGGSSLFSVDNGGNETAASVNVTSGLKCNGSYGTSGQVLGSTGSGCQWMNGSGLGDPGSNGIVKRTATNTTGSATASDVVGLFGGGACSGYLKSDGSCSTAGSGSVVGPASSTDGDVAVFNGTTGQLLKDSGVAAASLPSQLVLDFTTTSAPAGVIGSNPWIYTLPTGNHICTAYVIGGGAGGGSGAKCSNSSSCYGGGGGGGAPMQMFTVPCSYFGSTVTVTVGAGGNGGTGQSSDGASGNNGINGSYSQIAGSPGYGSLSANWSSGSFYGSGGTPSSGSGGSTMGDPGSMFPMCAGAAGSSGTGNAEYCVTAMGGPAGGAGGGGMVSGTASNGGMQNSGQQSLRGPSISASTQSGGAAPGGNGQTPAYANTPLTTMFLSAFGGSGGASNCAGNGGKGGDGMFPGGGGGGGGAACNGYSSGGGGKGGDGFVRIIVQ